MGFFIFILIALSCHDSDNPTNVDDPDDKNQNWVGVLKITLKDFEQTTNILGTVYDGPTPASKTWDTVMSKGDCKLIVPRIHNCGEPCPGMICAEDNTCKEEPDKIGIGSITVNGLDTKDGTKDVVLEPVYYMPIPEFNYPPFKDNDEISFSVTGTSEISSFSLSAKGFDLLNLHNENILYEDNKPIKLTWDPPPHPDNSFIYLEIDISYHGGTKAQIICRTQDDGELTIPADMLDKLKTYGIFGFPRMVFYRRNQINKKGLTVIIEHEVTRYLTIPGYVSCGGDEPCPDGYECNHSTKLCEKID